MTLLSTIQLVNIDYIFNAIFEIHMNNEQPLPGLFITDDKTAALEAMFSRNFDIVILRHPDPLAFEASMRTLCAVSPELISQNYSFKLQRDPVQSNLIATILQSTTAVDNTTHYEAVKQWLATLKEVAERANPTFPNVRCSTRSIYEGIHSPFFGFHRDVNYEIAPTTPLPWRTVITLLDRATKIVEERRLKAACSRNTVQYAEAVRIAETEFPLPQLQMPALMQGTWQSRKAFRMEQQKAAQAWAAEYKKQPAVIETQLKRAARREEILLSDVKVVSARAGDMVFVSQTRPKHLWHGSPQYSGGMRLGLVLDHNNV